MPEYTDYAEALVYQFDEEEQSDCDYQDIMTVLNTEFRTFGDALSCFIRNIMPTTINSDPAEYLKKKSNEKHILIVSNNTLTNWFRNGLRPKKGNRSREIMYRIAFSLELTVPQTSDLFHKVYLDRAFNNRNPKELIYRYCLLHRLNWNTAQTAIEMIKFSREDCADQTIHTIELSSDMERAKDLPALIQFINLHPHNFSINNVAAKERLQHYLTLAGKYAATEAETNGNPEYYRNMNRRSTNFLYTVITDQFVNGLSGTKPISFKNSIIPQEIKNNFPSPEILSKQDPTYEEIRKSFIMLFSYCFWCEQQKHNSYDAFDEYRDNINLELAAIGHPQLYQFRSVVLSVLLVSDRTVLQQD